MEGLDAKNLYLHVLLVSCKTDGTGQCNCVYYYVLHLSFVFVFNFLCLIIIFFTYQTHYQQNFKEEQIGEENISISSEATIIVTKQTNWHKQKFNSCIDLFLTCVYKQLVCVFVRASVCLFVLFVHVGCSFRQSLRRETTAVLTCACRTMSTTSSRPTRTLTTSAATGCTRRRSTLLL